MALRFLLLCLLLTGTLAGTLAAQPPARHAFDHPQMGTLFRLVLYAPDTAAARAAAGAAFAHLDTLNGIFSDYHPDSELSRLSATAGTRTWVPVSAPLWDVLRQADHWARRSRGAFDPTVGPLVLLWRRARRRGELPPDTALAAARRRVDYRAVRFRRRHRSVCLARPGVRLDLGGIAKGYAAESMRGLLARQELRSVLIDAGGDVVAGAAPPGEAGWRVAVTDSTYIVLHQAAVATSGDLYQYVEIDGVRYSHLTDPRTGLGLTDRSRVTVVAPDGTTADALASAVSVLGPRRGLRLVRRTPGAAARVEWWAAQRRLTRHTSGFPAGKLSGQTAAGG